MSQISQPVRIALLAVIVIAAAYFLLLRPHAAPSTTPPPVVTHAAPTTSAPPTSSGPLPPGVAGLSRAVQKARAAAGQSDAQSAAAQAANPTATSGSNTVSAAAPSAARGATGSAAPTAAPVSNAPATSGSPSAAATAPAPTTPPVATTAGAAPPLAGRVALTHALAAGQAALAPPRAHAAAPPTPSTATHPTAPATTPPTPPAATRAHHGSSPTAITQVQQELSAGKTVAILFWNPNGSDDQSVRAQLRRIDHQDGNVVTHVATASHVTDYGTVVTSVQIYETPTIVIINPKGQASTLVGLQDYQSIDQAINDAEQAAGTDQLPQLTSFVSGSPRAAYVKRANAMCTRIIRQAGVFQLTGSLSSAASAVRWSTGTVDKLLSNLLTLSPPAADGAYVEQAVAHMRRAQTELNAELAAVQAGDTVGTRTQLLKLQADDDRAGIMFTTYGLTACADHSG